MKEYYFKVVVIHTLVKGLCADGGHHKQYYLEYVLKTILNDEEKFEELKKHYEWEEGIPG